jgi:hypothetical protein
LRRYFFELTVTKFLAEIFWLSFFLADDDGFVSRKISVVKALAQQSRSKAGAIAP